MVGIAHNGIAFPITWTTLDHGGGSGAGEHAEVLGQFLRVVEPDQIRALVADREFTGSDFLETLKEQKVPFVTRLKSDRRIGPSSGGWSLPARMFARTCGLQQSNLLGGNQVASGAETVEVEVGLKRLEDGSFKTDHFSFWQGAGLTLGRCSNSTGNGGTFWPRLRPSSRGALIWRGPT